MAEEREFFFAWQGASSAWDHLRVVSFRGHEALSELYWFEIELHRPFDTPDVNVEDLIGAAAALKISTRTDPEWRIIHGVVSSAVELGDVRQGARYRVLISPPFIKHAIARLSYIYLDKTLRNIVEDTLKRSWGAAMQKASGTIAETSDQLTSFAAPKMTFEWRVLDVARLDDAEARPYCVQYLESSWAFVSRLLEEEGIAYHFEHSDDECRVVFTDADASRITVGATLGPGIKGREIPVWHAGGRLRPRSVNLDDYNWRKPPLVLGAESRSAPSDFATVEWPGRYEASSQTGVTLANAREERFDTERRYSSAEGRCRVLSAGSVFQLDHPKDKFDGKYLVTAIEHEGYELGWFTDRDDVIAYLQRFECLASGGDKPSTFRPARATPLPRIYGTQTAIVTGEPGSTAEINVGGPSDIGCVRVRFLWDSFNSLRENEPTSCWIRVSQFFAGSRDHGALWHPRVGDEVIVEFLHGDPDRPIVTGRVYNGTNLPPHSPAGNPTVRPTYSAIHSLTSPYDGNYNKMSFEDLKGEELIHIHAARDMTEDIERNYTRNTKAHDAENAGTQSINVGKWQTIDVGTWQRITTGTDQTIEVGANQNIQVKANQTIGVGGTQEITVKGDETINALSNQNINVTSTQKMVIGGDQSIHVTGKSGLLADAMIIKRSPIIKIGGFSIIHAKGGSSITLEAGSLIFINAPEISNIGDLISNTGDTFKVFATTVDIWGTGTVKIHGPEVNIDAVTANVTAATVNVEGKGTCNIKGGTINLNC